MHGDAEGTERLYRVQLSKELLTNSPFVLGGAFRSALMSVDEFPVIDAHGV